MTMRYDFDLVCIGSGPAGQRAVVQAAKLGKRTAVVERERVLGGVCAHTGTIRSKTFREAVLSLGGRAFLSKSSNLPPRLPAGASKHDRRMSGSCCSMLWLASTCCGLLNGCANRAGRSTVLLRRDGSRSWGPCTMSSRERSNFWQRTNPLHWPSPTNDAGRTRPDEDLNAAAVRGVSANVSPVRDERVGL